jgi:hypothetical protein
MNNQTFFGRFGEGLPSNNPIVFGRFGEGLPSNNPIVFGTFGGETQTNNPTFGPYIKPLPYEYYLYEDSRMIEILKNMHIILNPLCKDENYITHRMIQNFPNFIYETSCFKLFDTNNLNYCDIYDEIFYYINDNEDYDNDEIFFDLTDNKDRLLLCVSKGYIFLFKKIFNYLIEYNFRNLDNLKLDNILLQAIKNNQYDIVKILVEFDLNLLIQNKEEILFQIMDIERNIVESNIELFLYLLNIFPEIDDLLELSTYQQTNNILNYDVIIEQLQHISSNNIDIKDCPICYESKSDLITECNHQYCTLCINQWWTHKRELIHKCPYCKTSITPTNCKKII